MPRKDAFSSDCFDDQEIDHLDEAAIRSVEDGFFEEDAAPIDKEEVDELIKIMDRKHTR